LIKTYSRYSLKSETVDALVRIGYETNANLKEFNAVGYVLKWVKEHSRADDTSRPAGKDPDDNEDWFSSPYNGEIEFDDDY
jgi:hypothetical protein